MTPNYKNKNRGYQQLRTWNDAVEFFAANCKVFRALPYDLRRVASQAIASSDSVHRNIAEGYCRRSVAEYVQFCYYALGSLGESVSGLLACQRAEVLSQTDFDKLNILAYKLENELLKLVESLELKKRSGDWTDHLAPDRPSAPEP